MTTNTKFSGRTAPPTTASTLGRSVLGAAPKPPGMTAQRPGIVSQKEAVSLIPRLSVDDINNMTNQNKYKVITLGKKVEDVEQKRRSDPTKNKNLRVALGSRKLNTIYKDWESNKKSDINKVSYQNYFLYPDIRVFGQEEDVRALLVENGQIVTALQSTIDDILANRVEYTGQKAEAEDIAGEVNKYFLDLDNTLSYLEAVLAFYEEAVPSASKTSKGEKRETTLLKSWANVAKALAEETDYIDLTDFKESRGQASGLARKKLKSLDGYLHSNVAGFEKLIVKADNPLGYYQALEFFRTQDEGVPAPILSVSRGEAVRLRNAINNKETNATFVGEKSKINTLPTNTRRVNA